jgi:hypothetical protein
VILNAPFGTSLVYRILKGMLPTGLQDKASQFSLIPAAKLGQLYYLY